MKFRWFLLIIFITLSFIFVKYSPTPLSSSDPRGLYAYLPMVFSNHSLEITDPYQFDPHRDFLTYPSFNIYPATGKYLNKYPPGVAILQLPAYFFHQDLAIEILASIYLSIGLWFLQKTLTTIVSKRTALITTFLTLFGTNLIYYAFFEPVMSHLYSFTDASVFTYFSFIWSKKPKSANSIWLGILWGLSFLLRNQNGLIIIFFIWLNFKYLKQYKKQLLLILFTFLTTISPQIIYHLSITGKFWVFTYLNEPTNFFNPSYYGVLLSPRKGLFFYTPMLLIGFLPYVYKKYPKWLLPSVVYLFIQTYFIASWGQWWFGDSFGHRAFVDYLPFFALLISYNLNQFLRNHKKLIYLLLSSFILLNLFLLSNYLSGNLPRDHTTLSKFISLF